MATRADLDALSSRELHDLAVGHAVRHGHVAFVWELLRAIPAAEAMQGDTGRSGADLDRVTALISDALGSGKGETADALRPLYLDYLTRHDVPVHR